MALSFLSPIDSKVISYAQTLHHQSVGQTIKKHTQEAKIPSIDTVAIAFIGVCETRGALEDAFFCNLNAIRKSFYRLFTGNWSLPIADLGDILPGETITDTYFAITKVVSYLLSKNVIPVFIGGSKDLTYAMYRGYDQQEALVNLVSVSNTFNLGSVSATLQANSYLSSIILDAPNNLFNFSNLGYQSYFIAQEELDVMQKLFFDTYRLGQITSDITVVEPVLRDADVVSFDMDAMQNSDVGFDVLGSPNGFNAREICAVSRYAGISDRVSSFGVFQCKDTPMFSNLVAQVLWYFIEGVNFRAKEYPFVPDKETLKYNVPVGQDNLCFYKSMKTGRWWVEIPFFSHSDNKTKRPALLPCTHRDYLDACNQILPDRWWKAYQKNMC